MQIKADSWYTISSSMQAKRERFSGCTEHKPASSTQIRHNICQFKVAHIHRALNSDNYYETLNDNN